jgi:hypothetical protein
LHVLDLVEGGGIWCSAKFIVYQSMLHLRQHGILLRILNVFTFGQGLIPLKVVVLNLAILYFLYFGKALVMLLEMLWIQSFLVARNRTVGLGLTHHIDR